jgi:hypothetical protein
VYHLGIACFAIGQAALGQLDIRRVSLPYLRELNRQTRETIHLTVRHGLSAVYVEKLDSPEQLRIHSRIGAAVPLYCTAVGKIMLAYMSDDERDRVLPQLGLKRLTPNTVGSLQELKAELHRVRKNSYACDLEEHEPPHPMPRGAHPRPCRRRKCQPQYYRSGGTYGDHAFAATRAVDTDGGNANLPGVGVSDSRLPHASTKK